MEVHSRKIASLWWDMGISCEKCQEPFISPVKLTFEELSTILIQVEACLNSRPLVPINSPDDDGIELLIPGHFLIGKPITALPDPQFSYKCMPVASLSVSGTSFLAALAE